MALGHRNPIDRWSRSLDGAGSLQYVGDVRRFAAKSGNLSLATERDLVDYVMSLPGHASRRRVVTSLRSFYTFMHDEKLMDSNPARKLSKRIKAVEKERPIWIAVCRVAGETLARSLRWKDVLAALIDCDAGPPWFKQISLRERQVLLCTARQMLVSLPIAAVANKCAESVFVFEDEKSKPEMNITYAVAENDLPARKVALTSSPAKMRASRQR